MRKLFTLAVAALISAMAWSVTPEKMSYQAVIRNSSEQLVVNKKVGMRISILQNSETGTAVYTETQTPTTNANGLVSLEIGAGKSSNNFSTVDWSDGPFFIKTETDPSGGTNYTISGVSQLLSVPYALHSKTVEIDKVDDADADPTNEIQKLSLSGTSLTLSKNGGTVTLPSSGGGDNWGTQTAVTNATLEGNGSTASPLKIAQQGATSGQTLKWNGTAWTPGNETREDTINEIQTLSLSGTSLTLSKNGGTVTLPSSGGGDNWGTQTAVTNATLDGNGSTASPLKIAQQGATAGQALKWNGTAWVPGDDAKGTGLTLPYSESVSNPDYAFSIGNSYGSAISGESLDGTGVYGSGGSFGVFGVSKSVGVYGYSESSYGVKGESSSSSGTGVSGINSSDTGYTFGVVGTTSSPNGKSVYGNNLSSGSGVFGSSVSGTGVSGHAMLGSGVNYGVTGSTISPEGIGVYGHNDAGSGYAIGVKGESSSSEGTGVFGYNSSMKGFNYGVRGLASSSDGVGVYGKNISPDGKAYGVKGESYSETGAGVYGTNSNKTGHNYGVMGEINSTGGTAVYGENWAQSGNAFGTVGVSYSPSGVGAYGGNGATTGDAYGVKGESSSSEGIGIYGTSLNIGVKGVGDTYGVSGESSSWDGIGVYGKGHDIGVSGYSESSYGVKGVSSSSTGAGVRGESFFGVMGESYAPVGYGVYGLNMSGTGNAFGVYGCSVSSEGYGVYGSCDKGIGVYGYSRGYAGYFRGRLVTTENVGIGTDVPEYKLDVAGAINLNKGFTGGAIFCNGREALWFNEEYFSWGYGGSWNFFGDKIYIGSVAVDPGDNMLVVNGSAAKPGGGTWATWSDIRLKDIQGKYEKGLSEIIKLKPVKFNYKAGNACNLPSDQNYVGFIAQDVQKVFPEAVSEGKDGYLSLDANAINVALVNAIKELKAENDRLKAENKKFEDRLSKIEKLLGERK